MLHPHFVSTFPNTCISLFLHGLKKKATVSARTLIPVYNSVCHHIGEDFNNNNNNNIKASNFIISLSPVALQPNVGHGVLIPEFSRSHTVMHHSW
jgi:hypothetical protein